MAQDLKKMFENYEPEPAKLPGGHEARFEEKLNNAFSETTSGKKNDSIPWLKIAAIAIVFFAVGVFGYQQLSKSGTNILSGTKETIVKTTSEKLGNSDNAQLTLANISPDLKKIEEYYMTGINVQLASLKINDDNRELVDGYMIRLAELDKEYTTLNTELNTVGPTEATISALIENLKIRLDLLFKLKNKLIELNNQNNEEFKVIQT